MDDISHDLNASKVREGMLTHLLTNPEHADNPQFTFFILERFMEAVEQDLENMCCEIDRLSDEIDGIPN